MKILLLIPLLLLAGCATSGRDFDITSVQRIEKASTTRGELEQWMGKPMAVGFDGDGNQTATWLYTKAKSQPQSFIPIAGAFVGGVDVRQKQLIAVFDERGVVIDFNYNDSESEMNYGLAR